MPCGHETYNISTVACDIDYMSEKWKYFSNQHFIKKYSNAGTPLMYLYGVFNTILKITCNTCLIFWEKLRFRYACIYGNLDTVWQSRGAPTWRFNWEPLSWIRTSCYIDRHATSYILIIHDWYAHKGKGRIYYLLYNVFPIFLFQIIF